MTDTLQPIRVAAYRLAEISDVLARAQQVDFDAERDMKFVDVDAEIAAMNNDPSQRLKLAGIMLYSPSLNEGMIAATLDKLRQLEGFSVKPLIAFVERQVAIDRKHREDLQAVIADERRKSAEAAKRAEDLSTDKLLARIEALETQIEERG